MFCLKKSKININHIDIFIILASTKNSICLVIELYFLFTHNFQATYAILFAINNLVFSQQQVTKSF